MGDSSHRAELRRFVGQGPCRAETAHPLGMPASRHAKHTPACRHRQALCASAKGLHQLVVQRGHAASRIGIVFDRLFTLANMPIKRFGSWLISKGKFEEYLGVLRAAHRAENEAGVMCRTLVSVDYRGYLYDCDFNQMLGLPQGGGATPRHLRDLLDAPLDDAPIAVAGHCYGCTAGQGSSCGGALDASPPTAPTKRVG